MERRRCAIHWEHIPALIEEFPDLRLERTLYVFDGDRITCAGGLAAFDMMAALIARRHGDDLAMAVSEWYLRTQSRSGEDSQRVSLRERYRVANESVAGVGADGGADRNAAVARGAGRRRGVTLRQLERLFASHLHETLSQHYLGLRLERARKLLRQTSLPVVEVAIACGFVASGHFSRVYRRASGIRRGGSAKVYGQTLILRITWFPIVKEIQIGGR